MLKLEKEVEFIYKTFAKEWISCEDQQEFWKLQADSSRDMGRILYSEDMVNEIEKEIDQLMIVAGRLGLNKDILDYYHDELIKENAEKALA